MSLCTALKKRTLLVEGSGFEGEIKEFSGHRNQWDAHPQLGSGDQEHLFLEPAVSVARDNGTPVLTSSDQLLHGASGTSEAYEHNPQTSRQHKPSTTGQGSSIAIDADSRKHSIADITSPLEDSFQAAESSFISPVDEAVVSVASATAASEQISDCWQEASTENDDEVAHFHFKMSLMLRLSCWSSLRCLACKTSTSCLGLFVHGVQFWAALELASAGNTPVAVQSLGGQPFQQKVPSYSSNTGTASYVEPDPAEATHSPPCLCL